MYGCLPSINLPSQYSPKMHKFGCKTCFKLPIFVKFSIPDSNRSSICINSTRFRDAIPFPSDEHVCEDLDFGLLEKEKNRELRLRRDQQGNKEQPEMEEPTAKSGIDEAAEDLSIGEVFKFRGQKRDGELVKGDDTAKHQGLDSNLEELERYNHGGTVDVAKSRRQLMRRSNVMAKQVISIRSALSLGFVSQLWVDTSSVGDVILVEDENGIEDDLKLVGLETLVGYTVVTPRHQTIGKVRGYTFNINSGTVELLELDSFGISIIPSSLVSTYAVFVDDVLEVFHDTVVVHDSAVSRLQRLTKGLWDGQNAGNSNDVVGRQGYADYSEKRRKSRKFRPKKRRTIDDWELPMDYL